jgi:hypothetical protein
MSHGIFWKLNLIYCHQPLQLIEVFPFPELIFVDVDHILTCKSRLFRPQSVVQKDFIGNA